MTIFIFLLNSDTLLEIFSRSPSISAISTTHMIKWSASALPHIPYPFISSLIISAVYFSSLSPSLLPYVSFTSLNLSISANTI